MATKGGFDPDNPLPFFLRYDEPEQGIGYGRAAMSARFVVASILVATATATEISILSAGNPVTLFADVTASLADKSAPQPTDQSAAIIQPVVIQSTAEAPPLIAQDVPTREINDPEPASQTKMVTDEALSEALFREFQVWNAEQDARGLAKPVQGDPAPAAKNASASVRPMQKHRMARTIRNGPLLDGAGRPLYSQTEIASGK